MRKAIESKDVDAMKLFFTELASVVATREVDYFRRIENVEQRSKGIKCTYAGVFLKLGSS